MSEPSFYVRACNAPVTGITVMNLAAEAKLAAVREAMEPWDEKRIKIHRQFTDGYSGEALQKIHEIVKGSRCEWTG